jgi:hypothetical protein
MFLAMVWITSPNAGGTFVRVKQPECEANQSQPSFSEIPTAVSFTTVLMSYSIVLGSM